MIKVNLLDQGINDIKNIIVKLRNIYKKKYKKDYKIPSNKVPLKIWFKRGNITLKNGEWSKRDTKDLTLEENRVVTYLDRKNLEWGILGYGDPSKGLKELMRWVKNNLNPAKLKGDKQDLKMIISGYKFKTEGKSIEAIILIEVPEKGLGNGIKNEVLEKKGYITIQKFRLDGIGKLDDTKELDKALITILGKNAKLSDIMKNNSASEDKDIEDSSKNLEDSFYDEIPYGFMDVKKWVNGRGRRSWDQIDDIEIDEGDGQKLADYFRRKGEKVDDGK